MVAREDIEREARLNAAEREASELSVRAERVAEALSQRLRRNHWGQAVEDVVRRRA